MSEYTLSKLKKMILLLKIESFMNSLSIFLFAFFAFITPLYFFFYLTLIVLEGLASYFFVKDAAVIDLGKCFIKPLAKFRIGNKLYRIQLIPLGVYVNNQEKSGIVIFASGFIIVIAFLLSVLVFWIDGWPDLDNYKIKENFEVKPNWIDKLNNRPYIKVISYKGQGQILPEDIIVRINGYKPGSILDAIKILSNSDFAELQVQHPFGNNETRKISIVRRENDGRFGIALALSLNTEKKIFVKSVKYRGDAYNAGVRPGDTVTVYPMAISYLSRMVFVTGIIFSKFNNICVRKGNLRVLDKSGKIREANSGFKVPVNNITVKWLSSLELREFHKQYKPNFWESIKFSLSYLFRRLLINPGLIPIGGNKPVQTLNALNNSQGFNIYCNTIKKLIDYLIVFGIISLIFGVSLKLFPMKYWFFFCMIYYFLYRFFNSFLLAIIEFFPYAEVLFKWEL